MLVCPLGKTCGASVVRNAQSRGRRPCRGEESPPKLQGQREAPIFRIEFNGLQGCGHAGDHPKNIVGATDVEEPELLLKSGKAWKVRCIEASQIHLQRKTLNKLRTCAENVIVSLVVALPEFQKIDAVKKPSQLKPARWWVVPLSAASFFSLFISPLF